MKAFIFQYDPASPSQGAFAGFWRAVDKNEKYIQPKNVITANKLETIYRIASQNRMDLLSCLAQNQPDNIYELSELLQRDYANVWKDVKALSSLGIIKLVKKSEGRDIKPIALYSKIVINFPIVPEKTKTAIPKARV